MSWVATNHQSWRDRGCFYSTGLKLHKPSSLYQTQIWIARTFIVYYSMEELVTLYYGNFSLLGEWVREFAWSISCSNQVAGWTLWSLLFLIKFQREHLGWSTTQKQEWGLFLWEWMLHNVASLQRKECWRCFWGLQLELAKSAPEHPSVQTLLGSPDSEILRGACSSAQDSPLLTRWVHEGNVLGTHQAHGQG